MNNKKKINIILVCAAVAVLALILCVILFSGRKEKDDTITVGFVMSGSMDEQGWNGLHYQGIKEACDELQLRLIVKEEIAENSGQCEGAIRELAEEKADIIILSSYGYAAEVQDLVREYNDIVFYSESFDYSGDNLNCYFARIYQARYLAGVVAGMETKTDCIGYVAAMPNCEVNRGINAFTLGVQSVNPNARVIVAWSNSWDDSEEEKRLAEELIVSENVDILTYHQNQPNVVEIAEQYDIASIGYHENAENVSENYLTSVVFHWNLTYKELVLDYMKGKSDVVNTYWFGLDKNAIGLTELSSAVSEETRAEVEAAKESILMGVPVFSGKIYDTNGTLRCDDGENISDEILMREMDWYVKGVDFYEE